MASSSTFPVSIEHLLNRKRSYFGETFIQATRLGNVRATVSSKPFKDRGNPLKGLLRVPIVESLLGRQFSDLEPLQLLDVIIVHLEFGS